MQLGVGPRPVGEDPDVEAAIDQAGDLAQDEGLGQRRELVYHHRNAERGDGGPSGAVPGAGCADAAHGAAARPLEKRRSG